MLANDIFWNQPRCEKRLKKGFAASNGRIDIFKERGILSGMKLRWTQDAFRKVNTVRTSVLFQFISPGVL